MNMGNSANPEAQEFPEDVDLGAVIQPQFKFTRHGEQLLIEVVNGEGTVETPTDMVICIDVSGSMSSGVVRRDEDGNEKSDGLSILDIVKHAALTLVSRATNADRVSIVTFTDQAEVAMPMTVMNEYGRNLASDTIKSFHPLNGTNFWAGITQPLDVLYEASQDDRYAGRNAVACVLTDGIPTQAYNPTEGFTKALENYFDQHPNFSCGLNMIGFGYQLDSKLLDEISRFTRSNYSFVPDGTMVGTVFIHLGANVAVTSATNAQLKLEFGTEGDLQKVLNDEETDLHSCYSPTQSGATQLAITLGRMAYGQNRSIVIPAVAIDSVALTYTSSQTRQKDTVFVDAPAIDDAKSQEEIDAIQTQFFRQLVVSAIRRGMAAAGNGDLKFAQNAVSEAYRKMMDGHVSESVGEISKDLTGQITEAFSRNDWYNRWGRHYLPSIACAYVNQVCNNFKDPGVQSLGGDLFGRVRDQLDELFNNLPDPEPSRAPTVTSSYSNYKGPAIGGGVSMMSTYNSASAACFRGDCLVTVMGLDGATTTKRVDQIVQGDLVAGNEGREGHRVEAVVVSKCAKGVATFVKYGDCVVTPYHPIYVNKVWQFPVDVVGSAFEETCDYVYNFVLESGHVMNVGGVSCVTLAHGFDENACVKHGYFGTDKIVEDLKKVEGYGDGRVVLGEYAFVRASETGLIVGLDEKIVMSG